MAEQFEAETNPQGVKKAEMVVCIPSYNEADSIAYPVMQADEGLTKHFADQSAAIIFFDN